MPNLGSVLLVLVLLTVFPGLAAPFNAINAASISTIPYQGRLADASGNPVTGKQNMEFRLYSTPTDGAPLWEEFWTGANSVDVSDGLFSVMLGSINTGLTAVVQGNNNLYLGITVGTDSEMTPRVQLGSVPFSIWSLTVADDSITTAKIADGAVTSEKLARTVHRLQLPSHVEMPLGHTEYTAFTLSITLEQETLVTILASVGAQNSNTDALFRSRVYVDGEPINQGESWNKTGIGETIALHNALLLAPGGHQIVLTVLSWTPNGFIIGGDGRTQLVVTEG